MTGAENKLFLKTSACFDYYVFNAAIRFWSQYHKLFPRVCFYFSLTNKDHNGYKSFWTTKNKVLTTKLRHLIQPSLET